MNRNKKCLNFLCFVNCKCVKMKLYCLNFKVKKKYIYILDLFCNNFISILWFFLLIFLIKKSRYDFFLILVLFL